MNSILVEFEDGEKVVTSRHAVRLKRKDRQMTNEEYKTVISAGIETLAHGDIVAQLDRVIGQAIENCVDPNTDPKAARTITLKIQLKSNEKREHAQLTYSIDLKLPSDATGEDQVFIRRLDGKGFVPRGEQLDLGAVFDEADNVAPIDRAPAKEEG